MQLIIRSDLTDRITSWIKKGLDKDEKTKLMAEIPKKGDNIILDAPILNDEVNSYKSISRDEHFKNFQNSVGSILAASATVLSMILDDSKSQLDRQAVLQNLSNAVKLSADLYFCLNNTRKIFASGGFEAKFQKKLRKTESTSLLFGEDMKTAYANFRALERMVKEARPKFKPPPIQYNNPLNIGGSTSREGSRTSQRSYPPRSSNSRKKSSSRTATNSYPAKNLYPQSQPHQDHRGRR